MSTNSSPGVPMSERTTVRRGAKRAEYRREEIHEILRVGSVAHVAAMTAEGPLVLPMAYGISGETMYLHGALANALLRAGADTEICATVTIVDGLVFAKTPFNHSMNYRCVVVRGQAQVMTEEEEITDALHVITDHIVPSWDITRHPSASEIKATRVIALPLTEVSAKIRSGGALNQPEDVDAELWSGYIPTRTVFGEPVSDGDAHGEVPGVIAHLPSRDLHIR
jgi:uncharacterized protein